VEGEENGTWDLNCCACDAKHSEQSAAERRCEEIPLAVLTAVQVRNLGHD
jgi:hypothetical protein